MGIIIRNNIVNQKGNPAWYEDTLSARPIANLQGRMFVDTDNPSTGIYRDTGSTWINVADPGAGTTGTLQQVTTNGNTTTVGIISNTVSLPLWNTLNSDSPYYFGATNGSDFFKIFGAIGSTYDQTEMVFQVGDNGLPYASNGERFRFTYDNSGGGTSAKDVLIIDYTSSYFNTNLGINTATPSSPLDVHTGTGINATFNGTGTTNSILQFQLAGTGKWNLGNLYNAGANDFIIRDVTNTLNRITVKNTGQTFIGADTTSSGLFIVNSSTSDNHIVAIGANAPSFRLRDAGSGGVLSCGIGISTATNNFIQGSANGNYCIFNANNTASPILFGIYDSGAGNTQEAVRISAARNFIIGKVTDSGQKLQIAGNVSINAPSANPLINVGGGGDQTGGGKGNYRSSDQGGTNYYDFGRDNLATGDFVISELGTIKFRIATSTGIATFTNSVNIGNSVAAGVAVASTHKVSILIGGVQYYLLASNV
jgi:hypothetical protein